MKIIEYVKGLFTKKTPVEEPLPLWKIQGLLLYRLVHGKYKVAAVLSDRVPDQGIHKLVTPIEIVFNQTENK